MNKIILLFAGLFFLNSISFGQTSNDRIMFVVDSIPVIDDPEEGNEILQTDVADITVIKNKDTLKLLGYGEFDGVTFLFTKEYRNRPENIKQIPSSKQMEKKNGTFLFRSNLYSGQFIDYYYSGRKQGEGIFLNGKLNGHRKMYYQNGKVAMERDYKDGIENAFESEYYEDGSLKQKGEFVNGKEEGIWESFYPNGQIKLRSKYKAGEVFDTATKYYSTGKIKEIVFIKNGKVIPDPSLVKINQLMTKSNESNKEGDIKAAIKYCSKVIELDSTYAAAYFSRGTIKLNEFQFDEAIADFDKALKFEPLMEFALTNRAFARIRKYQFASSRTLSQNSEVTVLASKDKVPIPQDEQEKICNDLQKAVFLGDKSKMITEALSDYCQTKSSR
jgi:antitoxin component YwqK of YwqJK toxin-antitoxin module